MEGGGFRTDFLESREDCWMQARQSRSEVAILLAISKPTGLLVPGTVASTPIQWSKAMLDCYLVLIPHIGLFYVAETESQRLGSLPKLLLSSPL